MQLMTRSDDRFKTPTLLAVMAGLTLVVAACQAPGGDTEAGDERTRPSIESVADSSTPTTVAPVVDGADNSTTTTAGPTTAPATESTPGEEGEEVAGADGVVQPAGFDGRPLAGSVDDLVARWESRNRLLAARAGDPLRRIEILPADVFVNSTADGRTGFIVFQRDGVVIGGETDGDGAVITLTLAIDVVESDLWTSALFTGAGLTADTADDSFEVVIETYEAAAAAPVGQVHFTKSGGRSFVAVKTLSASDDAEIIKLFVLPGGESEAALVAANDLQDLLLALLDG